MNIYYIFVSVAIDELFLVVAQTIIKLMRYRGNYFNILVLSMLLVGLP